MKKIKRPLLALFLFLAALSFAFTYFFPEFFMPSFVKNEAEDMKEGEEISLTGTVYKTQEKTYSVYVYLKDSKASLNGEDFSRAGEVLLIVPIEDYEGYGLKIGNRVYVYSEYEEFSKARNNGNYDEEDYYNSLGIFLKASASEIKITSSRINYPAQAMALLKEQILNSFEEILTEDEEAVKGVFAAVTTGEKSSLTEGVKSLYSENGISHILAVSGLHISLIGMGLFSFLKKFLGPYRSGLISSIVMFLYCLMCGLSVSCLRAVIMFAVRMGAVFFGKTYDLLSSISLAGIIILLSNPFYILNSGFLFSFCAVLSVALASSALTEFLKPKRSLGRSFIYSLSITLANFPLTAGVYYTVPVLGVFLNLLVIPLMSFVLGSALAGGLMGIVSSALGRFFMGAGYYAVCLINLSCYLAGLFPLNSLVTGRVGVFKVFLFYGILGIYIYFLREINKRDRRRIPEKKKDFPKDPKEEGGKIEIEKENSRTAVLFQSPQPEEEKENRRGPLRDGKINWRRYLSLLLVTALLMAVLFARLPQKDLEIIMFDVDQGDGILIKTPAGDVIMIDGGSTGEDELWAYRLESALEYEGVTVIDYEIITHPDSDHTSGILDLLEDETTPVRIENLLIPYVEDNENYTELIEAAQEAGVNVINIYSGMEIRSGEVTLSCIHPDKGETFEDTNDYSCVLSLSYGDFCALFTGDISSEVEESLLSEGKLEEDYDLLKVAHHGSKYSSCSEFLSALKAETALISAGVDNTYGHPSEETLERLSEAGAEVYVTAGSGEIKVSIDKEGGMEIWTMF